MIYISLKRYCSTQGKSKLFLKTGIPLSEVVVVVVVVGVVVVAVVVVVVGAAAAAVVVVFIYSKEIIVVGYCHPAPPLKLASRYDSFKFNSYSQ